MKVVARFLTLIAALVLVQTAYAQPLNADERRAAEAMANVGALVDNGEIEEAARIVRGVVDARYFRSMRPDMQAAALQMAAGFLLDELPAQCGEALPLTDRLLATRPQAPALQEGQWRVALWASYLCNDDERIRTAITGAVRSAPDLLTQLPDELVLEGAGEVTDAATLSHFVDGRWQPKDPAYDLSYLRLRLTRLYLRAGDVSRAREAAQGLVTGSGSGTSSLILLLVEKEFDPVTQADTQTFDFDTIMAWQFNNLQARAAATPDSLALQIQLGRALLDRNRPQEALDVTDAALARVTASAAEAPAFTDQADQVNWLHDLRSTIIEVMGNPEDALAAMQQGVEAGERGSDNVSQLLNRSADLVRFGRPAEALEHIERLNLAATSPYGQMVALRVKACAQGALGDTAAMRTTLSQIRRREEDSFLQVREAALCANDLDWAARTFIHELQSDNRGNAVLSLQRYLDDEPKTAHEQLIEGRRQAMYARRDVAAAIDRIARRQTFAIREP